MVPADSSLRWSLAGTDPQGSLLDDGVDPTRELREVEYLHVRARTIISEATQPTEIGWRAVQAKPCSSNCVEATDVRDGVKYSMATRLGAAMTYTPSAGKITIEYKNVSDEPVTINVYRVRRTCEAEACKFLPEGQKRRWLVFKVDEFTSIETSKDESYSLISGRTIKL